MVVPVLGRMSDMNEDIRSTATNTFASLVKMVPLEVRTFGIALCVCQLTLQEQAGLPDPPGFSEELLKRRESERKFLTQLLDGSRVEQYPIPVLIKAELRRYQQDGVNWLAFLAKYQLHGILCDGRFFFGMLKLDLANSHSQTWDWAKHCNPSVYWQANTTNEPNATKKLTRLTLFISHR